MDTTRLELGRRVAKALIRENNPDPSEARYVVWARAKNAFDIARARRRIADGEAHVSPGLARGILGPGRRGDGMELPDAVDALEEQQQLEREERREALAKLRARRELKEGDRRAVELVEQAKRGDTE